MEKTSYGLNPWINSILAVVSIQQFFSLRDLMFKTSIPRVNFRTYSGVAGLIRRRMVVSISIALFSGSFSILIGFFLYAMNLVNLGEAVTVVGLLFVMGIILNGWLILRLMRTPLQNIEYVEDSLVRMVETGSLKLEAKPFDINYHSTPFLVSFYSLLEHVDLIETRNLEFLAKMSHEIRSPLASMLGYSELITDPKLREDEQFIENCYQIIRKEGNQVCRLVEDAVLAAGIDSGRYEFEFTPLRLDELLYCLIEEEKKRTSREIIFQNSIGEIKVEADAIGIREAIKNLIDNGIKFSSADTPLIVCLSYGKNSDFIEIEIKDYGIGIEEKDKSILYRRFSRIRNERTNNIPGNGLGLYIANNIVINHQGGIEVNTMPNEGSSFTITLPLEQVTH